jgi:predicted nuclease of predicted toxin-antitoxin system
MRILLDMNLTPLWRDVLAKVGHEVEHWSRVGRPDAPDIEILDFAREGEWVIITQDLDFGSLLALRGDDLPSVIQIRALATLPGDIGKQVIDTIEATAPYLVSGALVTLTPNEFRVTALPIRTAASD